MRRRVVVVVSRDGEQYGSDMTPLRMKPRGTAWVLQPRLLFPAVLPADNIHFLTHVSSPLFSDSIARSTQKFYTARRISQGHVHRLLLQTCQAQRGLAATDNHIHKARQPTTLPRPNIDRLG